jgi:hypothetical protein
MSIDESRHNHFPCAVYLPAIRTQGELFRNLFRLSNPEDFSLLIPSAVANDPNPDLRLKKRKGEKLFSVLDDKIHFGFVEFVGFIFCWDGQVSRS